jgi:hypothetical protein
MPFRSTQVFIHNETDEELNLIEGVVNEGEWGHGGAQAPPSFIAAGKSGELGTDSTGGILPKGTEGHVRYRIGGFGPDEVYLHWNNPVLGSNGYNQHIGPSHDVIRRGGGGNNAVVEFHVRPSVLHSTGFLPTRDGFPFTNHWDDAPYTLPPLRGTILDQKYGNAANGLCGGMVFAARDYFEAGLTIPTVPRPPAGEQDPLFRYLVDRLFDTFEVDSVSLLLKLMDPIYPDTDENPLSVLGLASGRASVMADIEWPVIRDDIDGGHSSPVCLVTVKSALPWDLGKCHQVLAYAYQVRGEDVELHVYDPNQISNDVAMRFSLRTVAERIVIQHNVGVHDENGQQRPIYCFVRMNYTPRQPTVQTAPRPPASEPQQVWLQTDQIVVRQEVVESGRKVFPIMGGLCGEGEFDYQRVAQTERITVTARTRGFIRPVVSWQISNTPVPAGAAQSWAARVSPVGVDADPWADVVLTTTTSDNTLVIQNRPDDGQYSFPVQVSVTEGGSGTPVRTTVAVGFIGARFISPELEQAGAACLAKMLDELRQASPTDAEMVEAIMRQLGRPPDPLWDPDPLLQHEGWETLPTINRMVSVTPGDLRVVVTAARGMQIESSRQAAVLAEAAERAYGLEPGTILGRTTQTTFQ